MKPTGRGLLLAALHLAIVASLGGKLALDRATRPRVWLRAAPVDPYLPIRGRYLSLRLEVPLQGPAPQGSGGSWQSLRVRLVPRAGGLVAVPLGPAGGWFPGSLAGDETFASYDPARPPLPDGRPVVRLEEPVAFFIPETGPDPSRRVPGAELRVEVTVPRRGPLRPIRLGVWQDGQFRILDAL